MAKVLVVDDDTNVRNAIKMFLQQGGYEVVEAGNGREAVDAVSIYLPDAVILDVMTPGMDGFTACSTIKSTPETKNIPVILCTAKNRKKDLMQALKSGADEYIVKPFTKDVVLEKVAKALLKKTIQKGAPPAESQGSV